MPKATVATCGHRCQVHGLLRSQSETSSGYLLSHAVASEPSASCLSASQRVTAGCAGKPQKRGRAHHDAGVALRPGALRAQALRGVLPGMVGRCVGPGVAQGARPATRTSCAGAQTRSRTRRAPPGRSAAGPALQRSHVTGLLLHVLPNTLKSCRTKGRCEVLPPATRTRCREAAHARATAMTQPHACTHSVRAAQRQA